MAEPTTLYNRLGESITVYAPSEVARLQRAGWAASVEAARAEPPAQEEGAVFEDAGVTIVTDSGAASSAPGEYSAPAGKVNDTIAQQMNAPAAHVGKTEKRARR